MSVILKQQVVELRQRTSRPIYVKTSGWLSKLWLSLCGYRVGLRLGQVHATSTWTVVFRSPVMEKTYVKRLSYANLSTYHVIPDQLRMLRREYMKTHTLVERFKMSAIGD